MVALYQWVAPLRSSNSYGLFAVMTTVRREIVVEGSNDGVTWLEYEFKYKPGDLKRRPGFVEPHQPRLDWQMWFAALGSYQNNRWFVNFCIRLLEGKTGRARACQYACVAVLRHADGRKWYARGEVRGQIATAPAGSGGFGYDPVFFVPRLAEP